MYCTASDCTQPLIYKYKVHVLRNMPTVSYIYIKMPYDIFPEIRGMYIGLCCVICKYPL